MKLCPLCDTAWPNHHTNCEKDGAILISSGELEPGTVIRGKYRIVRTLGRGGMGTVYLAEHILLVGRQRALKFISSELNHDPKFLKRFRLEAQAAIELKHQNVVEVGDLDQDEDGSLYIAMEYVEGTGLRQALTVGPFGVDRALDIARGVALGLGAAHARGIIHRDVKPENILLAGGNGKPEIPKLVDFGLAAMKESSIAVSRTRGLMLTPEYAAPEQWKGTPSEELDGRVDLYALGGVLHEMLTGRTSFISHHTEGWRYLHLDAEPVAPSRWRPELANWEGLDALVLRLLAKNREDRPATADHFVRELDAIRREPAKTVVEGWLKPSVPIEVRKATPQPEHPLHLGPRGKSDRVFRWVAAGTIGLMILAAAWLGVFAIGRIPGWMNPPATGPSAGTIRENPRDGQKYAWIPEGTFRMGCSQGDMDCSDDEKPPHNVSIAKGFWMAQTTVTVGAWNRYEAARNPAALPGIKHKYKESYAKKTASENSTRDNNPLMPNMPAVLKTWGEASSFCQSAGMRLPSEAEWEYAARAGTTGARYGDLKSIAWYGDNSGFRPIAAWWVYGADHDYFTQDRLREGMAHKVAEKQPNPWQLYDMLGNVWQWQEWDGSETEYQGRPVGEPSGEYRVLRGGSWADFPNKVRASGRLGLDPDRRYTTIGFRCVGQL